MTAPDRALLPANASDFEWANSQTSARLLDLPVAKIQQEREPANCDAAFLPFLAWERSVHFWDPNDVAGNQSRIESSFNDHLNYGTPDALEAEIALDTGQTIQIREFWEERDLTWPDFVVESVINPGDPAPDLDAVWTSAIKRKNVRDMPKVRTRVIQPPASVSIGAAHRLVITMRTATQVPLPPFVGAAHRLMPKMRVRPL